MGRTVGMVGVGNMGSAIRSYSAAMGLIFPSANSLAKV